MSASRSPAVTLRKRLLDAGEVFAAELDVHGRDVLLEVVDGFGSWGRDDIVALVEHRGEATGAPRSAT